MRKCRPILLSLLLLAGCGADDPAVPEEESATLPPAPAGGESDRSQAEQVRLELLIARAMPSALADADKASYRAVRAGVGGAACGEVATPAAGGGAGPFRPFVVTPQALAVVGTGPAIAFDDPSDFLADAWIRWCATPEELQRLGPEVKRAAAAPPVALEPSLGPDLPPVADAAADPAPPPPPPPRPAPKRPPPPPQIDSFFNSVQPKEG